jgi:ABC-type thiamine transport system ATPase subunit
MSMQAESLEVLEKANLSSTQARAIVRAIEIEIAGAKDVLATRQDIVLSRSEVRQDITLVRSDMRQEVTLLRSEMAELGVQLRSEMKELATELRSEMTTMRGELRAEIRTEINTAMTGFARQMYAAMLGQMAVLLGIVYFFLR